MFKGLLITFLVLAVASSSFAQETKSQRPSRRGENAGYGSRDATVLSMMGWGLGLGVGVCLLCGLIQPNSTSSDNNNTSH